MNHRQISRLLALAGTLATAGILFVFYLSTPLRIALNPAAYSASGAPWSYMGFKAVLGLPYLAALWFYFRVCLNIGDDRSFCPENVRALKRITVLMLVSAALWLLALLGQLAGFTVFLGEQSGFPAYILLCVDVLALMAGLAVALVSEMMAHLVNRAVTLQEDSDLTI